MSLPRLFAGLGALLFTIGAAGCAGSHADADVEQNGAAALTGGVPAGNCELFVDRAAPHFDSHGVEALTLYLKTPLGKLDAHGGIKSVGYHARAIASDEPTRFRDMPADRFVGAADYWEIRFVLQTDFSPTTSYEGAFYVEAGDGTRFWVNAPEGGPNFEVDTNMFDNLANLRPPGFFETDTTESPATSIVAADEFPYLNPTHCR